MVLKKKPTLVGMANFLTNSGIGETVKSTFCDMQTILKMRFIKLKANNQINLVLFKNT